MKSLKLKIKLRIKNCLFLIFLTFLFFGLVISTFAKSNPEVGIVIGKPSGISGKYFLSDKKAVDCSIGFGSGFMTHFDFLWHNFESLKVNEGKLPYYYGGGLLVSEKNIYAQGKIGLEYLFDTNPLGMFIEIAPAVGTDFIFQGGVGVRYRLK